MARAGGFGRGIVLAAALGALGACGRDAPDPPADAAPTPDAARDAAPTSDAAAAPDAAATAHEVAFHKLTLHREFSCEGTAAGDIDGDGHQDVVAGPRWYAGPRFDTSTEIWSAPLADPHGYSRCFFQWTRDFDRDGALDVLVVGFPGEDAAWYQNPGRGNGSWIRHQVIDVVDMESPDFLDLTGDGWPELLFASGGKLGWAGPGEDPTAPWRFHPLSDARGFGAFGHGLGAADVDGDGRLDVLEASAWWRQPASLAGDPVWQRHEQAFGAGGGQMAGTDVDGDGDLDVIATLAAHGYGLAFYTQRGSGDGGSGARVDEGFDEHVVVPNAVPAAGAEVILHEPHALALADLDGDGLSDVITGERFWGHVPEGMPDFSAPARLYWFGLERSGGEAHFRAHLIDDDSGIGTQITTADLDADGLTDIAIANKKGAFLFLQRPPDPTPRLRWARSFERERVDGSEVIGVLSAAPVGLVRCGDGLCALGKLDSGLRLDQQLVATGEVDAYLVKLSLQGDPVWSRRIGGNAVSDRFVASSLAADDAGNLTIAGGCRGEVAFARAEGDDVIVDCRGSNDAALIVARLDAMGRRVWVQRLGTSWVLPAQLHVAASPDGLVAAAAHLDEGTGSLEPDADRVEVVVWDANGSELFRRKLIGRISYPTAVAFDRAGNVVVVGFFAQDVTLEASGGDSADIALDTAGSNVCVFELSPAGAYRWSRCFGGYSQQALDPQLAVAADGAVVLAGTLTRELDFGASGAGASASPTRLVAAGKGDIYLAKLSRSGTLLWQRAIGGPNSQGADLGLAVTPDGTILLPALTGENLDLGGARIEGDGPTPFVAAFDGDGRATSAITLGSGSTSGAYGIVAAEPRAFFFAVDYSGELALPDGSDPPSGLTLMAGQY